MTWPGAQFMAWPGLRRGPGHLPRGGGWWGSPHKNDGAAHHTF